MDIIQTQVTLEFLNILADHGPKWEAILMEKTEMIFFGSAVSINSNGDKIVVGAQNNDGTASNAGHVRVFAWNGSSWNKASSDIDGESGSDQFGYSISMNSAGNVIAAGSYGNDGTASNAGHARVYSTFAVRISGNSGFRMMTSPVSGQVLGLYLLIYLHKV